MSMNKAEQFMESPLVAWVKTFDDYTTVSSVSELAEGVLLNKVMRTVDPVTYTMAKVNRNVNGDQGLSLQNLQLLSSRIRHFYLTHLQQLLITQLPNIIAISHHPESDTSLDELEKLIVLLLGCVVQCEGRGPLIEHMKAMDILQQQALVPHIQQVTDTTDYVCSVDWNDLGEISKQNLEALCHTAYIHLQRVAKERDGHFDMLSELVQERDHYKQQREANLNDSAISLGSSRRVPPMGPSPSHSPVVSAETLELKKKCRFLQEQLDQKIEVNLELKEDREQLRKSLHQLQAEKKDLAETAKLVNTYRDEIEALQTQSARVEKLHSELTKYKQKAEDTEYLKKRITDLKQQNDLMVETKALLEQKAASLLSRAEAVDDLQAEISSLRVQLDALSQEKEVDQERIEELVSLNVHLELECSHHKDQVIVLESELSSEKERTVSDANTSGDASSLSYEMSEADLASKAKVLRLEKEAREMERTLEAFRHSQAKMAELEKMNKKLYSNAHIDKREIIKLKEEVEVLKVKASRVDKLQQELSSQREKVEEGSRLQAKLKELKMRNESLTETKVKLEDELESIQSKASLLDDMRDENASLKAQLESQSTEHIEEQKRMQELLERNAQLELEKQRSLEEKESVLSQIEHLQSQGGSHSPFTVISPPRISESEMASRAKLQRLEKETKELEKTAEALRHSQAKLVETQRTNKKLQEQVHSDRKDIIKLKEELHEMRAKTSRVAKLESEVKTKEQKLEEATATRRKITELKQQNVLLSENKALLQDEVSSLQNKLQKLGELQSENMALKVRLDSMDQEVEEDKSRMQEILQQNAQLELDRDKKSTEIVFLTNELEQFNTKQVLPPPSPIGTPMTETDLNMHTKVLRLEKENRDLQQSLDLLKQSSDRAAVEREKSQKKLMSTIHEEKKEIARLKEELKRLRSGAGSARRTSVSSQLDESELQAKQIQDLTGRFSEAYSQSLTTKDERIAVLERRLEDMKGDNSQLREEVLSLKRQLSSSQSRRSATPVGSPSTTGMGRTFSPREMNRLRDQAAEALRLREKAHVLHQENAQLAADVREGRLIIERQEVDCRRLSDRMAMMEQLNRTLEEEKRTLLMQTNKLLEKNQDLLVRTLDSKDQAIEEERIFTDRLGELERQKSRLSEQLISQQREQLAREIDMLKKSKSKSLLKRGFSKLKGKIQGRSHTFEHTDGGGATQSYGSPSHGMSLPFTQEGSMSSSQSVSSSNSRHSDGLEEIDQSDPANLSLVPRAPTMDGSPFIRPRKGRSLTLPSGVKIRNPASTQSAAFPEGKDKEMSLEDFLAEDHTPNRRRVMELKRASLILGTPPVTPRNSMFLGNGTNAAGGANSSGMFDIQEFLSLFQGDTSQSPIPEETEPDTQSHSRTKTPVHTSSRRLSALSDERMPTPKLNSNNNNSNNSNSESELPTNLSSLTSLTGVWVDVEDKGSVSSSSRPTPPPALPSCCEVCEEEEKENTEEKGEEEASASSTSKKKGGKRRWSVLGRSRSNEKLKAAGLEEPLEKARPSRSKKAAGGGNSALSKKRIHRSSEDMLSEGSGGSQRSVPLGKPPLANTGRAHKSSSQLSDQCSGSDGSLASTHAPSSSSSRQQPPLSKRHSTYLSRLTRLPKEGGREGAREEEKGEGGEHLADSKRTKRMSLPVGPSLQQMRDAENNGTEWQQYGCL